MIDVSNDCSRKPPPYRPPDVWVPMPQPSPQPSVVPLLITSFPMRLAVFLKHSVKRFIADRCLTGASALSYATLVSLVPLTAVVLVIFSGFPIFAGARHHFLAVLLDNFVPAVGEEAAAWFN